MENNHVKMILNLDKWFRRICHLNKKFTDEDRSQ